MKHRISRLAISCAAIAVLLQIAWPLADSSGRVLLTTLSVIAFATASFLHCTLVTDLPFAISRAFLVLAAGFLLEFVGSTTGLLFGDYSYTSTLQPQIAHVPLAVMLAWFMMAWPAAFVSQLVSSRRWLRALFGGALMTSWDFFLDPQMVGEQYWQWHSAAFDLPGIPGIPLTNYVCWFIAGSLLVALLDRPSSTSVESWLVPAGLLGWTWFGGVVGHAFFWGRSGPALWGGVSMGLLLALAISRWRRDSRE